jgi:hypothetical protein
MRARRTAIVPNMIWGTAMASIVPLQLTACGGSSNDPGSAGSAGQVNHAGSTGQCGHANAGAGGTSQGFAGYIVLAIAAFGNEGGSLPGAGTGGSEVMLGGSGGESAAGSGGKQPDGSAGFIVLAAAAFGGAKQ